MRSINANSFIFFSAFILFACTKRPEYVLLQGTWNYTEIRRNDSLIVSVNHEDLFILRKDSTFEYRIASVGKHMKGKWNYEKQDLILKYDKPDTVRKFHVRFLSNDKLEILENKVSFKFTRIK